MLLLCRAANPNTQQDPIRASQLAQPSQSGHPKMDKLCEVVVEHFNKFEAGNIQAVLSVIFYVSKHTNCY